MSPEDQRAHRDHGVRPGRLDARAQPGARGHSVAVIDQNADAFRRLGPDFAGPHRDRRRLRPRGARRGRHRAGRRFAAVSSGDNSNIISARLARETFGVRPGGRPHLRPAAGRGLRAARASRPWPPCAGPPTGWCATWCRRAASSCGATRPARCGSSRCPCTRAGSAARSRSWRRRGARVAYLMRFGIGTLPTASTVLQDGDQVFMLVTDDMVAEVDGDPEPTASRHDGVSCREGRTEHAGRHRREPATSAARSPRS